MNQKATKNNPAFMRPMKLSSALLAVVGKDQIPRTEVTKLLWAYIKSNDLQDPKNRRDILCNDALKAIFDKDRVNMFEMTKLLSQHMENA